MGIFSNIMVKMADGKVRFFVARENECWKQLLPHWVPDAIMSDRIRDFQAQRSTTGWVIPRRPMREVQPSEWPPEDVVIDETFAVPGTKVTVEDWDVPGCPDLTLKMTESGWVVDQ